MSIPTSIVYSYRGETYSNAEAAELAYERDMDRKGARECLSLADRRERIATAAMQAMELPNGSRYSQLDWDRGVPKADAARAAKLALIQADALIAELDRKGGEG